MEWSHKHGKLCFPVFMTHMKIYKKKDCKVHNATKREEEEVECKTRSEVLMSV